MSENRQESEKKRGCAPLGCLIIIIAIAVILFYLLVKPALEERGITVDSLKAKLANTGDEARNNLSAAEEQIGSAGEQAEELQEQTSDKLRELKQQAEEKLSKAPIRLYEE
jgi:hypothetical protein